MLGELVYCADGDGQPRRQERYGLTVLRAEVRPGGWGEAGRLKRAARRLARLGVCRVLVPEEFCRWELLCRWGLGPVDPVPFFRACAGGLALAALRREGIPPHQGTVALGPAGGPGYGPGGGVFVLQGAGRGGLRAGGRRGAGRLAASGVRRAHPAGQRRDPGSGAL